MKIKQLEMELADRDRELAAFRKEISKINEQLEKFIGQISSELKLAGHIQRSLVPTEIPTIPGFAFSTKFVASALTGGDYFDIFELQDKMQFGILMSNSSGHGMASLFLSVLLKLTTQIEAKKGTAPDEVLSRMTKEIQENLKGEDIARVFYAVVDRRRYNLAYCKAGEILAYIYKYSEDTLVKLDKGSGPVGKNSPLQFKAEEIKLDPRDKLFVISEGVTRVKDPDGKEFGEEKIHEILIEKARQNCHEVRNELLFQIQQFADHQDYPSDISVIVMEVNDKVIKLRKG